jgi:hypothetical protein
VVREPLDVVQHERRAAPHRQPGDRPFEVDAADGRGYDGLLGHRFERPLFIKRLGPARHPRLPTSQEVEALIHRKPVQPGAETRLAAETAEFPMGLQERFLQQVLGILRRPRHAKRQREKAPGVRAVQLLECSYVATCAPLRQLEVARLHAS